jgi:hypothetical protein
MKTKHRNAKTKKSPRKKPVAMVGSPNPILAPSSPISEPQPDTEPIAPRPKPQTTAPRLSQYAESLLNRKPKIENQKFPHGWLRTAEVARRFGYSRRNIQRLCEEGFFVHGEEWRQRAPIPGIRQGGIILINPAALRKLEGLDL